MRTKILTFLLLLVLGNVAFGFLGFGKKSDQITIGMTIDDLRLERWQHDRDIFTAEAEKLGAKVIAVSANGDAEKQLRDAENLISRGVDILVVIPNNGDVMAPIVAEAHAEGIKVLAYDRLITNSDVDYYISFDNVKVGELQAQAVIDEVSEGNFFLMGGSPTDNNARLFREGQMNVLTPYIEKGDINIVGDQWAKDWLPEEALKIMENALTATNNDIDAVVASNDSTAGGAIQALAAQNMAGKVAISGQDADIAAVKRVVDGTQTVTIYKPIKDLAKAAAAVAIKLVNEEDLNPDSTVNNGQKDVPSTLLTPIPVTSKNVDSTIIADGFHSAEDIYNN